MQFVKLNLQNFMSFEDQEFTDLDHNGLTLIEGVNHDAGGSNGAGKSAVWDAISFALFGVTARGLKADAVIHRKFKKNCAVDLELWFGGHKYIIRRYRKHDEFQDRFMVMHNKGPKKETVEKGTLDGTQKWLEEEFKIDYDLFKCTILFAQGETFNFVDSGNKAQKEILAKIMKVSYDLYLNRAKKLLADGRTEVARMESEIAMLHSHTKEEHELGYKEELAEWNENYKENLKRVKRLMGEKPEPIDTKKLEGLKDLKKKIEDKLATVKAVAESYYEHKHETLAAIRQDEASIRSMSGKDGKCSSCYQNVDKSLLAKLIKEKEKKIVVFNEVLAVAEAELTKAEATVTNLKSKLDQVSDAMREIKTEVLDYQDRLEKYTEAKTEYEEYRAEVNPFIKLVEEEKQQQLEIRKKIVELNEECEIERDMVPYYSFWANAFGDSGIKSFVFDLVCSSLTNKANKYLNLMSKGSVSVSFDTQKKLKSGEMREKFDCEIVTEGARVDYAAYSGGEKRRISLAVDMALAEIMGDYHGSNFNMIVFDEQTNYLDAEGRKSFMDLLKDLSATKAVFVVEHDSEMKAMFDNVWSIEKKNQVSRLM